MQQHDLVGVNTGPIHPIRIDLTANDYWVGGPDLVHTRVNEQSTPKVPFYPTIWNGANVVNKMAHVWKFVLDAMPNKFDSIHIQPNPERSFRALPTPQMGLTAVVEFDPNNYTGVY